MPVVSCPKCNKKFKLSSGQLGKTVKCSSCQTKFRTAAPAAAKEAGSAKPKAESKAKPKSKPAPPAKKKPKTLEDQLFASAPIKPGAPDPLGNFVLEDPGFGERELPDPEDDGGGGGDSDDNMFAGRQHLMNNPALKGRNAASSGSGAKSGDARKMRERLLGHEEAVKSLGFLQMLGGGFGILASLLLCVTLLFTKTENPEQEAFIWYAWIIFIPSLCFSIFSLFVGWSVYKLQAWAKIAATILLIPNLLSIPIGTAISGYFLWVLHNEKGKEVFSKEYQRAIKATPDMRPGKRLIIILGVLVVVLFLIAVGLAVFFASRGAA